jgi:hypothetical protein
MVAAMGLGLGNGEQYQWCHTEVSQAMQRGTLFSLQEEKTFPADEGYMTHAWLHNGKQRLILTVRKKPEDKKKWKP